MIQDALGLSVWPATLVAWLIAFVCRLLSLRFNWSEPEPWEQERLHEAVGEKAVQVAD
jgi:hypothetical protein